jgi:hypothetical protein
MTYKRPTLDRPLTSGSTDCTTGTEVGCERTIGRADPSSNVLRILQLVEVEFRNRGESAPPPAKSLE